MSKKKLYKSRKNKMIGGVCGGLAEYLNMDPTIVRVIAAILCLVKGLGLLVYLVMCIVMPYNDEDFSEDDTENLKSANINPDEEKKSSSKKADEEKDSKLHSDEDFDSYFNEKK
jgi:phage shock protein C